MPLARLWSRLVLLTSRVRWESSADPALDPSRPCVYAANHQSQFDIPAAVMAIPIQFRVLAKRSLFFIPIFGWVLFLAGFVGIDRSNRERAFESIERAARRIRRGTSLLIYAEGTRSPDGELLPFKKGGFVLAIQAGVPVIPLTIRGSREVLPKGSLRIRPGAITVLVGDPIDPREYSLETKEALMQRVRSVMQADLLRDLSAEAGPRSAGAVR